MPTTVNHTDQPAAPPDDLVWIREIESPVGPLTLVVATSGLRAVLWPDELVDAGGRVRIGTPATSAPPAAASSLLDAVERQLAEYFSGSRLEFDLPLDPQGTPFQQAAWLALRSIPYGQTVSYGEQARRLGDVRKARAVGAANGRNPISIIVPCHRVIGSNGSLTGFAAGLEAKSWLLDHERGQRRLA